MDQATDGLDISKDSDGRKLMKGGYAVKRWLAGEMSAEKCAGKVRDGDKSTTASDIAHYLAMHVFPKDQTATTGAQRENAERVILFLESGAEYRWPKDSEPKAAGGLGCSLGCLGALNLTVVPLIGLVLWAFLGRWWLIHGVAWPLIGGVGLVVLCILITGCVDWRYRRKLIAIWANPRAHTNRALDFCAYPFGDEQQMAEALASCPDFNRPLPKLEAGQIEQAEPGQPAEPTQLAEPGPSAESPGGGLCVQTYRDSARESRSLSHLSLRAAQTPRRGIRNARYSTQVQRVWVCVASSVASAPGVGRNHLRPTDGRYGFGGRCGMAVGRHDRQLRTVV